MTSDVADRPLPRPPPVPGSRTAPTRHRHEAPPLVKVGDFALLRVLASGANGRVYEARHLPSDRIVAVKTVWAPGPGQCALLRREIHALRRVRHPGVVRILAAGVAEGAPWYAMELVPGDTLADVIARQARARADRGDAPLLPVSRVVALGSELAAALGALEERGVVHGDLKPSNVLLRGSGQPVLVDFGFAARFSAPGMRTAVETPLGVAGTPCYLAPELLLGADAPDPRTDLYALGCILYELLAGEPPIRAEALERAWLEGRSAPRIRERVPEVPPALDELIASLLARRPADRLARAIDAAAALAALGGLAPPASPAPVRLRRSGLVGREAALAALLGAADAAREGRGGAVVVCGESGIGKSRLAAEWLRRIGGTLEVVIGEASSLGARAPGSGGAPLQALRPLLAHVADRCLEGGPAVTEQLLGGGRAARLAPFAPELAPLAAPVSEAPAGPAARARLFRALRETLEAATETPLALVLDDLQWCDEVTLSFLASLPSDWLAARGLLVFALLRGGEAPPGVDAFLRRDDVRVLDLDALDAASVELLARELAGLRAVPPALGAFLAARTGGNPLHVTELLGAALSARLLERESPGRLCLPDGREPDAAALGSLPLPTSLRALLAGRLAALGGDARRLVEAAAVLGRRFDEEALAELAGLAEEPALDAVAALLAAQVLDVDADGGLRFVHDQVASQAYAETPEATRRTLHARAADLLRTRALQAPEATAFEAAVAHHLLEAGEEGRAVAALARAAEFSMRRSAFADAREQWLRAVAIRDGLPGAGAAAIDTAQWLLGAAQAAGALGDSAAGDGHARAALARLGESVPAGERRRAARAAADFARLLAGRRWRRPVRSPAERARLRVVARASDFLVQARFFSDDLVGVVGSAARAVHCAERCGEPGAVLRSHATLASLAGSLRLRGVAEEWFALAGRVAETRGDESEAALNLAARSVYLLGEGRLAAAGDAIRAAARRIEAAGDASIHELVLTTSGHVAHYRADYAAAIDCYRHVLESGRARGNLQIEAWGHFSLGRSLLPCGRTAEARSHLEQAAAILARRPELQSEVICLGLLALARLRDGDPGGARGAAREALARLERARQAGFPSAAGLGALADVLVPWVAAGDAEAAAWLRRVLRVFARLRLLSPLTRPAFALAAGGAAQARGRRARARRHYRRGVRLAERFGLPLEQARALAGLAAATPEGDEERHRLRAEAARRLEAIGADARVLAEEVRR